MIDLGERDSNKTFQKSYDQTLKPHHNWMVQKLFTVGLKMVPDFEGFVALMAPKDHPGDKVSHPSSLSPHSCSLGEKRPRRHGNLHWWYGKYSHQNRPVLYWKRPQASLNILIIFIQSNQSLLQYFKEFNLCNYLLLDYSVCKFTDALFFINYAENIMFTALLLHSLFQ